MSACVFSFVDNKLIDELIKKKAQAKCALIRDCVSDCYYSLPLLPPSHFNITATAPPHLLPSLSSSSPALSIRPPSNPLPPSRALRLVWPANPA